MTLDHQALWMHWLSPVSFHSCVFITFKYKPLLILSHTYTHTHTLTHFPVVLHFIHSSQINSATTPFMIPNLCQQTGRPPLFAASLISSASCVCLLLHVRSMKQWYFLVTSNEFVRFKKGEEDKWRERTRGCEDNGLLQWLTFQSGASKKVWLSYCVSTDSQMNGGLGTGFVYGTEGNKHTMSNLHLGCQGVSLCVKASLHVSPCKMRVTHSPFSSFENRSVFTPFSRWDCGRAFTLSVSESAG